MKNSLRIFALLLSVAGSGFSYSALSTRAFASVPVRVTEVVYVCISRGSVAYHSRDNYEGINRCSHEVKRMSVADARVLGKRACMKCY